jgi:imidazolonepropionase-like amidohydrolase
MKSLVLFSCLSGLLFSSRSTAQDKDPIYLKDINLIDGTGRPALRHSSLLLSRNTISAIGISKAPPGSRIIDLKGKTIIPGIINAHGHLGLLKGTSVASENYTRENILRQLKKYQSFGVLGVLCLGTDFDLIFSLRDSSLAGQLEGADLYSAGYGFGVLGGGPGFNFSKSRVYRPVSPEEAIGQVRELAARKPDFMKIWVDDFYGQYPTMKPEIYKAIISEAHRFGIRVAAHVFHLEDARHLVEAGVDVLAHSIRDHEIDEDLLDKMKRNGVIYIPTLSLDEYQFIYTKNPAWIKDPFFKASLEPGVLEMISSQSYLDKLRTNPSFPKMESFFKMALLNLRKIYRRGIKVALGTDSGATPVRAQGFSEHLEMELMTEAGLTPLETIRCATLNGATLLHIDAHYGTIEKGKKANFMILSKDPSQDIKNTRSIYAVWKEGMEVSHGPLN